MLGILLAITAAFCWGTGAVFARLGLRHVNASVATFLSMLSSLVLVGGLALITGFDDITSLSPMTLVWFSVIGILNYFLGRQFNYSSIRYIGVTRASPLFASAPFFAIILAVIFLGEDVNLPIILGAVCVMVGLSLVISSK